jgi:hypothetical protein
MTPLSQHDYAYIAGGQSQKSDIWKRTEIYALINEKKELDKTLRGLKERFCAEVYFKFREDAYSVPEFKECEGILKAKKLREAWDKEL